MNNVKYIGVVGARNLPNSHEAQVRKIVGYLLDKGYGIASGGAIGTDAFALNALLHFRQAQRGIIFSAWQQFGQFPAAVKGSVRRFVGEGGQINWGLVPFQSCRNVVVAGLLGRNIKLVSAVHGLTAFMHGESRGTIFTILRAAKRNIPIVVFLYDSNAKLPDLPLGRWIALRHPQWTGAYRIIYS